MDFNSYFPLLIIWMFIVMVVYPILNRKRFRRLGPFDPMQIALLIAPLIFYLILSSGILGDISVTLENTERSAASPENLIDIPEGLVLNSNETVKINSTEPIIIKKEENTMYELEDTNFDFNQITI
jgi:hypothetical protein